VFITRAPRAWASLTVKRQGTGHTLTHGQIQVGVGQHNSRVVGIQAQYRFQAMRFGVHLFQRRRTAVGANEREHINLAALHQWADGIAAAAKNNIDHTGGERFLESLQQRAINQGFGDGHSALLAKLLRNTLDVWKKVVSAPVCGFSAYLRTGFCFFA
jgi:hypothetical protein